MLHLEHSFDCGQNVDTLESRSEIPGKFYNVVLKKEGVQLDQSYEKQRSITHSQERQEYPTYNNKKEGYLFWSQPA